MDWYWCGDWDCVATWFWSSGTGAALQFLATLLLLILTFCTWRHDRQSEVRRRREDEKNSVKKVGLLIGAARAYIGRLLQSEGVNGGFDSHEIAVTMNVLVKYQSLLMQMSLQRLPDEEVLAEVSLAWGNLEVVIQYLNHVTQIGRSMFQFSPEELEKLPMEIRSTLEQLRADLDRRLAALGLAATRGDVS